MKKIIVITMICLCALVFGCNRYKKTVPNENKQVQKTDKVQSADATMINGKLTVTNPDDILVVVNKLRNLPSDWAPNDLVIPNVPFPYKEDVPKKYMRAVAAKALADLFDEAEAQGIKLYGVSGYRSYKTQKSIYDNEVKQSGEKAAGELVALPGQSEHQTGLAIDVSSASMDYLLKESFGDSKEGKWLKDHAQDCGFIIRYPKDKEKITGYSYEPWHIRYVGKEAAAYIASNNITLDEYLEKLSK